MIARELVGESEDALRRQVASVLVHRREGRHHLVHESDLGVRHGDQSSDATAPTEPLGAAAPGTV